MRTLLSAGPLTACLLLVGLVGVGEAQERVNLAPNPGFEEDADGNGEPDGWWKWGGPGDKPPSNLKRVPDNPHGGTFCAQVRDSSQVGNFYIASQFTPVEGGKPYVLYVWARGRRGQSAAARIDELDDDKRYLGSNLGRLDLTDEWREYHVVAPALRPETAFVQISLLPTSGRPADTGVAWFDDVRLEPAGDHVSERLLQAGGDDWFPFPLDWRDGGPSPIDVTRYLPIEKTGVHGFLTVREGHFVFQDGTPARFWGTNIHSSRAAYPSHEEAESFAARLARLGVNMVRVHLLEYSSPDGLIDASGDTTDKLDPAQLDRFDYLMAQFHERGIYVILDALPMCARAFREGDGVKAYKELGLGAKGASLFDRRIIELEQSYARALLDHANPYRDGLKYADDPTIALYEMSNEDALLLWWSWRDLPQPYCDELQRRWNEWLAARYGTRAQLAARWTDAEGRVGLADNEDPTAGTVRLDTGPPDHVVRRADYQQFLGELQRSYYAEQVQFLRALGVRVPISGSNIMASPALMATCEPLDYTDTHAYWDHPQYEGGNEKWLHNRPMVKTDPIREPVLPSRLALARTAGKPALATEWNSLWPNQWRAADTLMTPAYALLNDLDIIYIYCYLGGWGIGQTDAKPKIHHATVIFSDPAQTGLFPVLALMYRRGDVRAARNTIEMGLSATDTYVADQMYTATGDFQHFMPLISRWQSRLFDDDYRPGKGVTVTVTSGRSATGDYGEARRLMLWAAEDWVDYGRDRDLWRWTHGFAGVPRALAPGSQEPVTVSGELPAGTPFTAEVRLGDLFAATSVKDPWRGWLPSAGNGPRGYLGADSSAGGQERSLAPGAGAALANSPDLLARWFTDAGRRWGLLGKDQGYNPATGEIVSDTGQLRWSTREGVWTCDAPRVSILAGFLPTGQTAQVGALRVTPVTDFATYSLVSLDGKTLTDSRHMLLTAVGRAENTGQQLKQMVFQEPGDVPEVLGLVEVLSVGTEPVLVQGVQAQVGIAAGAGAWSCWALDAAGRRMREVPVTKKTGGMALNLGPEWRTIYYELVAE